MIGLIRKHIIAMILIFLSTFIFLVMGVPILLCFSYFIWAFSILYSATKIKQRSALFAFLICYFIFLIGGDLTYFIFEDIGYMNFNMSINNYAYNMVIVSNITILLGYVLFEKINEKNIFNNGFHSKVFNRLDFLNNDKRYYKVLLLLTLFVFIVATFYKISEISYVINNGYYNYFINYYKYLKTNLLLKAVSKISEMLPIFISLIIATNIKLKPLIVIFSMLFINLFLSLFTGQRGPFMLGILYIIVYLLNREDFKDEYLRNLFRIIIILIPSIIFILYLIENLRFGKNPDNGILSSIIKLINSQGVSINTIKNEFIYRDQFPDKIYTLSFLYGGIFSLIFKTPRYLGNSIDAALLGHDFNHTLSYFVLGDRYLQGVGTGSSYIAEALTDFGVFYLIIISIIYSFILYKASNLQKQSYFTKSILLIIITSVFWGIRSNATLFLAKIFDVSTIVTVVLTALSYIMFTKIKELRIFLDKILNNKGIKKHEKTDFIN